MSNRKGGPLVMRTLPSSRRSGIRGRWNSPVFEVPKAVFLRQKVSSGTGRAGGWCCRKKTWLARCDKKDVMRLRIVVTLLMAVGLASGAAIDGAWTAEIQMKAGKKAGSEDRMVQVQFNLKSEGDKATGTITSGAKKHSVTAHIVDSKLEGNQFSFTTVQTTKKGE